MGAEYRIDLGTGTRHAHKMPCRQSLGIRDDSTKNVQEPLHVGVIEPANSLWAFPVILERQNDEKFLLCVNDRRPNLATQVNTYTLPRLDDLIDYLDYTSVFSNMDPHCGFWRTPMAAGTSKDVLKR